MAHRPRQGLFALVMAASLVTVGCSDRFEQRWKTVAEARRADLFARGWVPDILPNNAGPLVEVHNLDTNARCASARFAAADLASVRRSAAAVGFLPYDGERPGPPLAGCVFLNGDALDAGEVLRRPAYDNAESDFLILADGRMHFWSGMVKR